MATDNKVQRRDDNTRCEETSKLEELRDEDAQKDDLDGIKHKLAQIPDDLYKIPKPKAADEKIEKLEIQKNRDKLISHLLVNQTVDYENIEDDIQKFMGGKTTQTPVSMLMQYAQSIRVDLNFVDIGQPVGPGHKLRFTIVAVVDGKPYTRVTANNKKDCKIGASYLAWQTIFGDEIAMLQDLLKKEEFVPNKFAILTHVEYLKLVEKNPYAYTGRRVLAAIIMTTKVKGIGTVVSLGTGNRCIGGHHLTLDGTSVNDSHAEVIARRGFARFLYRELKLYRNKKKDSIFTASDNGKLKLRKDVKFHLYISLAPCGDSALFTRTDDADPFNRVPIFDNKLEGMLRTKLEGGEGNPPVGKEEEVQTILGVQFGKRLRTMCCSAKICKWNVVGLQGALLSHFLQPVYLSSLVVGDVYSYGHISRAVYYRLSKSEEKPEMTLPNKYNPTLPDINQGLVQNQQKETAKTLATSVNWHLGEEHIEVIEGNTGRVAEEETDAEPRISKALLYKDFKAVWSQVKGKEPDFETYHAAKMAASDYQNAKSVFIKTLQELNYGSWLQKPTEIDLFS